MEESEYTIGGTNWPGMIKMVEEAGELIQVCSKIIGNNGNADRHYSGTNLRLLLEEELADMQATILFFKENNELDSIFIEQRTQTKLEKFRKWRRTALENDEPSKELGKVKWVKWDEAGRYHGMITPKTGGADLIFFGSSGDMPTTALFAEDQVRYRPQFVSSGNSLAIDIEKVDG